MWSGSHDQEKLTTVASSAISHTPRLMSQDTDDSGLRSCLSAAAAPISSTKVGAQRWVTSRIAKKPGVVVSRLVGSAPAGVKKPRTWSSAISAITTPRRASNGARRPLDTAPPCGEPTAAAGRAEGAAAAFVRGDRRGGGRAVPRPISDEAAAALEVHDADEADDIDDALEVDDAEEDDDAFEVEADHDDAVGRGRGRGRL